MGNCRQVSSQFKAEGIRILSPVLGLIFLRYAGTKFQAAEKLVLDWRKWQHARAEVRMTIEQVLNTGLSEAYSPEVFKAKAGAVYQHVYEAYYGAGNSIYSNVA